MHDPDPFPGTDAANETLEPGASNGGVDPGSTAATVEQQLSEALARADQYQDQFLRAKAEAENIRRRGQEDVAKAYKFAIESFAEALVPVADSLEKALQLNDVPTEAMREGIELTLRQLKAAFAKGSLKEIEPAVGDKFDPHFHQAISTVPGVDVAPNHVVAVLQKGWMIADRVLRPALVTVSQA